MQQFIDNLISRLEECEKAPKMESPYNYGWKRACQVMKNAVNQLAEEYKGGWISVKDRLPSTDENRKYLVCGEKGGIYIAEFVCKTLNNTSIGPWWSAHGRYCPSPIAWMPLPEPYQKEGE